MSTIQPEVLNHMISVISEIDPAHLDNREVIAYLAGISETATGMLQLKPDLKAHADLVMDLANRAFHASRETEARNAALWTEVETLRAEVARLTKQRDAFYLQLNDARHETDQQRAKRIVLRSKMIAVEEERDQARADLAALHAEAARLRAALDRAERAKAHGLVDELMQDAVRVVANDAIELLLRLGAWGLHDGRRKELHAMALNLRDRLAALSPPRSDERGEVAGTDTVEAQSLTRPFTYLESENLVTLHVNSQGSDGLAFVAIPARDADAPYEQYGVVLPRDIARNLALRMLATLGPETSALCPQCGTAEPWS